MGSVIWMSVSAESDAHKADEDEKLPPLRTIFVLHRSRHARSLWITHVLRPQPLFQVADIRLRPLLCAHGYEDTNAHAIAAANREIAEKIAEKTAKETPSNQCAAEG
ncbi:hypothetical protein H6G88_06505 [Bifidobacterium ruminantium]|uniref:hypothetical protein n=1 Tax=Bifidobacterium ruminantium TaxID=78346 RepID=UPI001958F3EC|nr:hypothetical protein [Bifidobacterium ruminantium]MBM6746942.1 hypothetical protein [Bifidobacterium ruminantium]